MADKYTAIRNESDHTKLPTLLVDIGGGNYAFGVVPVTQTGTPIPNDTTDTLAVSVDTQRHGAVLHRDAITVADKLTDAVTGSMTIADGGEDTGALAKSTTYYAAAIPGNRWGPCKINSAIDTVATAAYTHDDGSVLCTLAQGTGPNSSVADYYDLFFSTDAAPKWIARITEAQRVSGCRVIALGTAAGDDAASVAGKIRTALGAVSAITDYATVSGSGATVVLTKKVKEANDTGMNIALATGTAVGLTAAATSTNTTAGVLPVAQVETATVVGTITTTGHAQVVVTAVGMTGTPLTINDIDVQQGTLQAETATVAGGPITTAGNARATVTAVGMTGTPKNVDAAVISGTLQVETATVVAAITTSGNATFTTTAAGMTGSPNVTNVAVSQGVKQVETATVVGGPITTAGNAQVVVTAAGMTGTPITINDIAVSAGTPQVETATVVGTITAAGYADVTVTGAGITGSPVLYRAYVDLDDTATIVATKIKAELDTHSEITNLYTITTNVADVIMTRKIGAANDATLNLAYTNGATLEPYCTGLTPDATSTDTTPGVAADDASAVATKIRTAMGLNADVTAWFDITGAGANIILARDAEAANDGTMNLAIDNNTCVGLTAAPTSTNTTAGVAADDSAGVAGKARTALAADSIVTAFFDVSGATDAVILTAKTKAANDATMNLAMIDGTCVGVTTAANSANTAAGVAPDTAATVAGKLRTALGLDADVSAFFDVTGATTAIILTAKAAAADDATMNIATLDSTCVGLTPAPTSANTTAGVVPDDASAIAGKIRTALGLNANVIAFFTVSGATDAIILTAKTTAANDATMNIATDNNTCVGITPAATSANTTAGVAGTLQVETATVVADITTGGTVSTIVTGTGLVGTPKTVTAAVVNTGPSAGVIDVETVGTGIQTSNAVFAQNNAYVPDVATGITSIDCTSYSKAYIKAKLALTDLRSAPALALVPFFGNSLSATDWHQGEKQTMSLLGATGQCLEQDFVLTVDGDAALRVLVDTISGQGAAASLWVELS